MNEVQPPRYVDPLASACEVISSTRGSGGADALSDFVKALHRFDPFDMGKLLRLDSGNRRLAIALFEAWLSGALSESRIDAAIRCIDLINGMEIDSSLIMPPTNGQLAAFNK